MSKKIINHIEIVLLILILIAFIIGARNIQICTTIQIIINVVMIIYLIIHLLMKKEIFIFKNKLDVFVLLLIISSAIPLIANSYISLYSTVVTILDYITLLWCYILTKQIGIKRENQIGILQNIIIGINVVLVLLGIENLTANNIFEILGITDIINGEGRLVSLIGNPNVLAVILTFSYFLSIHKSILTTSKKEIIIYHTINTILITGIVLTYSKAIFLLFPIMLIVYMLHIKNKEKNIAIMQNAIVSFIIAILYTMILQHCIANQNNLAVFVFSIFMLILSILINILNINITKYLAKIKLWVVALIVITTIVLLSIWVATEMNQAKEFVVFSENATIDYNAKKIQDIEPNCKYVFNFDMECSIQLANEEDKKDAFQINIIQRDKRNIEITNIEETFSEFNGNKIIELETTSDTAEIKIEFKSNYKQIPKKWIVKKLEINDKEVILEYKHLPTKLVGKIKDVRLNYKTAQERMQFIKDGLKLISQNFLTGIGGEGWQYKYQEVQEYHYISNDTHSYPIQIWLEFGIVGIISIIGITICIMLRKEERDIGIKLAILILLMHSCIDSDMYFMYTKLLLFLGVAILASKSNKEWKNSNRKIEILNAILVMVSIITIILYVNPSLYKKNLKIDELETKQIGMYNNSEEYRNINYQKAKAYEDIIKFERENAKANQYELKKIQAYVLSKTDEIEMVAKEYYEKMLHYHNKVKYQEDKIIEKSSYICQAINLLQSQENPKIYEWIAKLAKINIDEFERTKMQLEEAMKMQYKDLEKEECYANLIMNYEYSMEIYDEYFSGVAIHNKSKVDIKEQIDDEEFELNNKKDIVIYHTHTSEEYAQDNRASSEKVNVLKVGEAFQKSLQDKNFNVVHIRKYHDLQGINGAYDKSLSTLKTQLKQQNTKIDIIFDIHRDAYIENLMKNNYIEIDGEKVAKLRFVIAVGHENWHNNLKWAIMLQKQADKMYAGLFEPIIIYDNTYNQEVAKCATILEVGNNANTFEEAEKSIQYFSNVIESVINGGSNVLY